MKCFANRAASKGQSQRAITSQRQQREWWRWGGTNSGTNNPERSAFFRSEVVRRFLGHTTSDLRFRCVSGRSAEKCFAYPFIPAQHRQLILPGSTIYIYAGKRAILIRRFRRLRTYGQILDKPRLNRLPIGAVDEVVVHDSDSLQKRVGYRGTHVAHSSSLHIGTHRVRDS